MKMKKFTCVLAVLALLLPAVLFCQEKAAEIGSVEIGVRGVTGEVFGRPDLPFQPSLINGKFNEYRDLKNGAFVRSFHADLGGTKTYFNVQSQSSLYSDQSWLGTVGQYGKYKIQVRYDETPHTFTNTARTLFTQSKPGAWTLAPATRTALAGFLPASPLTNAKIATSLANITNLMNSSARVVDTSLLRKSGSGLASLNLTPDWLVAFQYTREQINGTRPIGVSGSGGSAEVPEPIDYTTNTYKLQTDYGKQKYGFRLGYEATTFENDVNALKVDNPFVTADSASGTAQLALGLYPSNQASNVNFAGTLNLSKKAHFSMSIVPGWESQNQPLLPYTTNTFRATPAWGTLPENSPDARRNTLAMNYVISTRPLKDLEVTAKYRYFDLTTTTPIQTWYPVVTDGAFGTTQPSSAVQNDDFGFNRKTAELAATWFFSKKNSAKIGYEFEAMDRDERDVEHTQENSVFASLDLNPRKDLLFRASYRHGDRTGTPFAYGAGTPAGNGLPAIGADPNYAFAKQTDIRRFDEAPRLRDRASLLLQYSPTQALTVSASFDTTQDNYNRRNGNEAAMPNLYPNLGTFYNFGLLKDIGRTYTFNADYALTRELSIFGEYARENYNTKVAILPNIPSTASLGCASQAPLTAPCLINAYYNTNTDVIDTWLGGLDISLLKKKATLTTYYSLSVAKGQMLNGPLNCVVSGADPYAGCRAQTGWALEQSGTTLLSMSFPESATRYHQVVTQLKFKLTNNLSPKVEYRYERYNNYDFQTSIMNVYMPSIQDSSNNSFLFLGADNPSYHAHVVAASLEYHF